MRRALAYFGFDGSATSREWVDALLTFVPPLAAVIVAARIDGVEGLGGFLVCLGYAALAGAFWVPLVHRLRTRR